MLDRFYTPDNVAEELIGYGDLYAPRSFADTACGSGNLLSAASRLYPMAQCVGADMDRSVIQQLRRCRPDWLLSVANILEDRSRARAATFKDSNNCDVLLLNPPFSMRHRKFVELEFDGEALRTSVAMAHILRSVEVMRPLQGVIAIVPESLLYSDLDLSAREALSSEFRIDVIKELCSRTFSGARAHTAIIRIKRHGQRNRSDRPRTEAAYSSSQQIVRGGLPLFEAEPSNGGLPLLHSTNIRSLERTSIDSLRRVKPITRGRVSGAIVAISRVGAPCASSAVLIRSEIQLSDCVIALQFDRLDEAKRFRRTLALRWTEFENLYRGTGARYLTVARLQSFLKIVSQL